MSVDYFKWIQKMVSVRDEIRALDVEELYHYFPPNKGCSPEELRRVEEHFGITIDKQYAEFLRCADGWREFFTSISLLGTKELIASPDMEMAKELLKIVYPLNPQLEFAEEELLPIAVDESGRCFFVITPPVHGENGTVIWFVGQEVERYDSFDHFLEAILQYNIDDLEETFKDGGIGAE